MDFSKSENQKMMAEMIRDFCEREIRPNIMKWDDSQEFPVEVFKKLGELGLMGCVVPEQYGGSGMDYFEYVTVVSEISKVDPSIGLSVAAHNSLCTNHILMFGSEEIKQKYLPKLATAEWIGAWGLTESNTGSDAGNMRTTAVRDGEGWVINGSKNFITHALSGDCAVIMARTGEPNTKNNATAFVIDKGTSGFYGGKKEDKLGMRASETAELIFDNVRIPDSQRLGEVGEGFKQAMKILDGGRISIAALALGVSRGAYEHALQYSKEREQFGQPISKNQAIAFKLADMSTKIEASELLINQASHDKNTGGNVTKSGAIAKYYSSEVCCEVANDAVQIYGGYGFTKEFPVEKFYRDAKLCTIGEGTSEIQKLVISRQILN